MAYLNFKITSKTGEPLNSFFAELWHNHNDVIAVLGENNFSLIDQVGQLAADGSKKPIGKIVFTGAIMICEPDDPHYNLRVMKALEKLRELAQLGHLHFEEEIFESPN